MDPTEQQSVAPESEAEATPSTEETKGAQGDDLDTLLAEYDEQTQEPESEQSTETTDDPVARRLEALERRYESEQTQQGLNTIVQVMRESGVPEDSYDDDMLVGFVEQKARKNPKLMSAWQRRHENPEGFRKVIGAIGKDLASRIKSAPDRGATEDREAVSAAVRSASTRSGQGDFPSEKEIAKMSDAEFFQLSNKLRMG